MNSNVVLEISGLVNCIIIELIQAKMLDSKPELMKRIDELRQQINDVLLRELVVPIPKVPPHGHGDCCLCSCCMSE